VDGGHSFTGPQGRALYRLGWDPCPVVRITGPAVSGALVALLREFSDRPMKKEGRQRCLRTPLLFPKRATANYARRPNTERPAPGEARVAKVRMTRLTVESDIGIGARWRQQAEGNHGS
jgi:hypothetical protein